MSAKEPPNHTTTTCVLNYGCQLPECRARFNARRRAIRAGTFQPTARVKAEPVRQHILDLMDAGLSATRIGRLAGVSHTCVLAFVQTRSYSYRGRKRDTTPEIARRILAVRPRTTIGTLRRIQALNAIGWPTRQIAARADVSNSWLCHLRPGTNHMVTLSNADKIDAVYAKLRRLKPEDNGVLPCHAERSRARAKANRWPTPKYWSRHPGDIDDPYFEPLYGITRGELIAQDAGWLMRTNGLDRAAAANRLGVDKSAVDRALRHHPQYDLEVAA